MRQSITNYHLIKVYRRELFAFWLIGFLLVISTYLLASAYQNEVFLTKKYHQLQKERKRWQKIEKILKEPFYRDLLKSPLKIQEAEIYQEISPFPFEDFLEKLEKLYLENGFLFVKEITYVHKSETTKPSIVIQGKKVYFR